MTPRIARYSRRIARLGIACTALTATAALPQEVRRDPSIANLPRPGYEPRNLRMGNIVIVPALETTATYNSNIFATDRRRVGDVIFAVQPSVEARRDSPKFSTRARGYARLYRYADNSRENANEFGISADGRRSIGSRQGVSARVSVDRTFQRRSDPEADVDRALRPVKINVADGSFDYRYDGPKFGLVASAGVLNVNYLTREDADRDVSSYRGSLRATLPIGNRIGTFVQGAFTRRDARLAVDRSGIDRDVSTISGLAGVSFDLTDRLQGELGGGIFRANPDAPGLESFSGLAVSGRMLWRPRVRTAVILDASRGDVATIRIGAIGRVDSRYSLSVDQEVYHNLLFHAGAGLRNVSYRGAPTQDQRFLRGELETRYLVNRLVTLVAAADYTRRRADLADNRFKRWQLTLGVTLAY
ncbi:outer membrane beta-barrel protein [Sphingomonas aerophila]|uniref:Outer membrane beta-barrel protein n=1 Tax=Sphingomonas aerophila TaxID=1344948 RepID=A0A7W9BBU0_9SPHN|nr:outer membrane beta-barrel protein [Sphingomonas aerophila]MBB5714287.1 hypothetical protein [Sphingomonas aerophila]